MTSLRERAAFHWFIFHRQEHMNFVVIYGRFRVSIYLSFERASTGTRIIIRNIKKFLKSTRWECLAASHDGHCTTTCPENIYPASLSMVSLRSASLVDGKTWIIVWHKERNDTLEAEKQRKIILNLSENLSTLLMCS